MWFHPRVCRRGGAPSSRKSEAKAWDRAGAGRGVDQPGELEGWSRGHPTCAGLICRSGALGARSGECIFHLHSGQRPSVCPCSPGRLLHPYTCSPDSALARSTSLAVQSTEEDSGRRLAEHFSDGVS